MATGSFTGTGVSATQFLGPNQRLDVAVTGTFAADVLLEFSSSGGLSWDFRKEFFAANAGAYTEPGLYRFRCISFTSGQVDYSLTPAAAIPPSSGATQAQIDTLQASIDQINAVLS